MSDFGAQLEAVHWGWVAVYAIWILLIPKFTEMNLRGLEQAAPDMPVWFMKAASLYFAILWPYLLARGIVAGIFGKRK